MRKWNPDSKSPWLTRAEAGDYLKWSLDSIDRNLVHVAKGKQPGKMRFEVQDNGTTRKIRIVAQDVYDICPLPPEDGKAAIKLAI